MSKIIDEIMDYVKSKNTDYAIMIDGKWGSGKTYFWTKELKPTIESTYYDQYNMYSTIYVSLYGLTSVEEINKKVFFELTQKMDKNINRYMQNRRIKDMSEFTKRGLDVANYYGLLSSSDKFDLDTVFTVNNRVICFDDFERASIDYNKLLGYINDFVEHDNIKVIILTNEYELMKKVNSDEYLKLKEKVVGNTYSFRQNYADVIRNLIKTYKKDREVYDLMNLQIANISKIIERTDTDNVRILNHAIQDYYKIFKMVTKDYEIDESILISMLLYTIAYSYKVKNEDVDLSKLINVNSAAFKHLKFIEQYLEKKVFDDNQFNKDMDEIAEDDELETADENNQMFVKTEKKKISIKEEPTPKIEESKATAKNSKADDFLDEIDKDEQELEKQIEEEFDAEVKGEEADENMISSEPEEIEIKEEPIEALEEKVEETYKIPYVEDIVEEELPLSDEEYVEALFKNLPMKSSEFFKMYEERGEIIPIFNYITTIAIGQRLSCMGDEDLTRFSRLLKDRTRLKIISLEVANLEKIGENIKSRLGEKESFNKTGLQVLANTIDEIVASEKPVETKPAKSKTTNKSTKSKTKTTNKKTTSKKRGKSTKA